MCVCSCFCVCISHIHHSCIVFTGLAVLNGLVYAVGGFNGSLRVRSIDVYDPVSDTWNSCPSMEARRSTLGVAVLNGLIFAVGGFDGSTGKGYLFLCLPTISSLSSFCVFNLFFFFMFPHVCLICVVCLQWARGSFHKNDHCRKMCQQYKFMSRVTITVFTFLWNSRWGMQAFGVKTHDDGVCRLRYSRVL